MPGTAKPHRERSGRGELQHKYKALKEEYADFRMKTGQYQGAVHELAKSATMSSRRVGMLTQTVLACRKHFAAWPHDNDCATSKNEGIDEATPCDCGKQAILESIDKALAEPDFDPGNVKIEIRESQPEVPSETVGLVADAPPASL